MRQQEMKKRLVLSAVLSLLCVALLGGAIYAWLSSNASASSVSFDILQVDSLINLYEANDANYNGVYDLLHSPNEGTYHFVSDDGEENDILYSNTYYDEKYSFNFVNEKWAQSTDTSLNLFDTITLENVTPGKIYGYKYEVINYLGIDNALSFAFEEDDSVNTTQLGTMEFRFGFVNSDGSVSLTDWTSFLDGSGNYSGVTVSSVSGSAITVPGLTTGLKVGRLDLWLQIRQKDSVSTYVGDFTLPSYRMTLDVQLSDD